MEEPPLMADDNNTVDTDQDVVDDFDDDQSQQDNQQDDQGKPEDQLGDAGKKALDRMKQEKNQAVKDLRALKKELDSLKAQSMTETEKAIENAKLEGRKSAFDEFGPRLARASFDTRAARRNPDITDDDLEETLAFVDMKKFLTEDGEPDAVALQSAVDRLVPAPAAGPPSQDGGVRHTSKTPSMNDIIRGQARGGRSA